MSRGQFSWKSGIIHISGPKCEKVIFPLWLLAAILKTWITKIAQGWHLHTLRNLQTGGLGSSILQRKKLYTSSPGIPPWLPDLVCLYLFRHLFSFRFLSSHSIYHHTGWFEGMLFLAFPLLLRFQTFILSAALNNVSVNILTASSTRSSPNILSNLWSVVSPVWSHKIFKNSGSSFGCHSNLRGCISLTSYLSSLVDSFSIRINSKVTTSGKWLLISIWIISNCFIWSNMLSCTAVYHTLPLRAYI